MECQFENYGVFLFECLYCVKDEVGPAPPLHPNQWWEFSPRWWQPSPWQQIAEAKRDVHNHDSISYLLSYCEVMHYMKFIANS